VGEATTILTASTGKLRWGVTWCTALACGDHLVNKQLNVRCITHKPNGACQDFWKNLPSYGGGKESIVSFMLLFPQEGFSTSSTRISPAFPSTIPFPLPLSLVPPLSPPTQIPPSPSSTLSLTLPPSTSLIILSNRNLSLLREYGFRLLCRLAFLDNILRLTFRA